MLYCLPSSRYIQLTNCVIQRDFQRILFHFCEVFLYNSLNNTYQTSYLLQSIKHTMDNNQKSVDPDPCLKLLQALVQKSDDLFLTHCIQTFLLNERQSLLPDSLPPQLRQRVQQLRQYMLSLKHENPKEYENMYENINQFLCKINPLEGRMWLGSRQFFGLQFMQKVGSQLKYQILRKMENAQKFDILDFIVDSIKDNDFKMLQHQLQDLEFPGYEDLEEEGPLPKIISIVVENRPAKKSILEQLRLQHTHYMRRVITIKNKSSQEQVQGEIKQIDFQNDTIDLQLLNKREKKYVKMKLNQGFIKEVEIVTSIDCQFQKQLKYLFCSASSKPTLSCELKHNTENVTEFTVIPPGDYMLQVAFLQNEANYQVEFTSKMTNNSYRFVVDLNNLLFSGKTTYFEPNGETKHFSWKQFTSAYRIFKTDKRKFNYETPQSNQKNIEISDQIRQKEADVFETLQTIQIKKAALADSFINQRRQLFQQLINLVFQKKLSSSVPEVQAIQSHLTQIIELQKTISLPADRQKLLLQLLSIANFKMIANKPESYSTSKILDLLAEAEQAASTLHGKDVLFFYGNTGSGKSTSISHFIGLSLQETTDKYGGKIVELKKEHRALSEEQLPKIGHSSCLSQTRYTKGYPIIAEKYKSAKLKLDNVCLADNPGFKQTRGTQFEVCTSFSMERAIDTCDRIRGIVLVVTYDTISQHRASNLVELIQELQQRFPKLLDTEGNVYPFFHIVITKHDNIKLQKISQYIKDIVRQLRVESSKGNNLSKKRLKIFQVLGQMSYQKKIHLLYIKHPYANLLRSEALKNILSTEGSIPKDEYYSAMKSNSMIHQFTSQISSSAHTWNHLILTPYLKTIPQTIAKLASRCQDLNLRVETNQTAIKQLRDRIKWAAGHLQRKKQELALHTANLMRLQRGEVKEQQFSEFKPQIEQSKFCIPYSAQRLAFLQKFRIVISNLVQTSKAKKIDLDMKRQQLIQGLKTEELNIKSFNQNIRQLSQTYENQLILKRSYALKELVRHSQDSFTQEQHRSQFPQPFQVSTRAKTTIAGEQEIYICSTIKVPRDNFYRLKYPQSFDPNKLIQKAQNGWLSTKSQHYATIQAKNTKLYAFKYTKCDRQISMGIVQHFKITENEKQLPFLWIALKVPGHEHNKKEIINLQSCMRICQQEIISKSLQITTIQGQINFNGHQIQNSQSLLKNVQAQIAQHEQDNRMYRQKLLNEYREKDRQRQIKTLMLSEQLVIKTIQDHILALNGVVETDKLMLFIKQEERNKMQPELKISLKLLETEHNKHRKLAFLIQTHLNKYIPETLQYFSEFALSKANLHNQDQEFEGSSSSQKYEIKNFKDYLELYSKVKDKLKTIVDGHLAQNIFDYKLCLD